MGSHFLAVTLPSSFSADCFTGERGERDDEVSVTWSFGSLRDHRWRVIARQERACGRGTHVWIRIGCRLGPLIR